MSMSRAEAILQAIIDGSTADLQPPLSRVEVLLLQLLGKIEHIEEMAGELPIHICVNGEYDPATGEPTVTDPKEDVFYLVPSGSGTNLYDEWVYTNGAWEHFGGGSALTDVQINSTSIVDGNGVANIPIASDNALGAVKVSATYGIKRNSSSGILQINGATVNDCKAGSGEYAPLTVLRQHAATFYGLASAAGDSTQSASANAVGTYTDTAKAAIQNMLGVVGDGGYVEVVSGTTPSITGVANVRYECGEVSTISITPPATGTIDVIFTSGSTAALLTLPNTVLMPAWFDASSLDTNTIYEIMITDATYGSVMTWETVAVI